MSTPVKSTANSSSGYYYPVEDKPAKKPRRETTEETLSLQEISTIAAQNKMPVPFENSTSIPSLEKWRFRADHYSALVEKIRATSSILFKSMTFTLEAPFANGHCIEARNLRTNQNSLLEGIPNDDLVVKIYKEEAIDLKFSIFCSSVQYKSLVQDFEHLPEIERPYATIYNIDTLQKDGFFLQEKVTPFNTCPWQEGTALQDLTEEEKNTLDQVKTLFHYSFLKDSVTGLDLWWPNLGIRPGSSTVVLFDYREDDDPFHLQANTHLNGLSRESPSIRAYILEGLLEKCENLFLREKCENLRLFMQQAN